MAKHSKERSGAPGVGTDGGLHEMPSGLYHTADSLADGPRGLFVDRFGPPGDPTKKTFPSGRKSGADLGKAPPILRIQQAKTPQKRIN